MSASFVAFQQAAQFYIETINPSSQHSMRTYEKWQSSQNLAQVSLKNASLKVDMKPNLITATNQDTLKILILSTISLAK